MLIRFELTPARLRVLSSVCSNIAGGFILAAIFSKAFLVQFGDLIFAGILILVSLRAEEILDFYND